tara:strand:- start:3069 stop:3548 length:480 start_codon:yes stop_codon:yes gene_type:complete
MEHHWNETKILEAAKINGKEITVTAAHLAEDFGVPQADIWDYLSAVSQWIDAMWLDPAAALTNAQKFELATAQEAIVEAEETRPRIVHSENHEVDTEIENEYGDIIPVIITFTVNAYDEVEGYDVFVAVGKGRVSIYEHLTDANKVTVDNELTEWKKSW